MTRRYFDIATGTLYVTDATLLQISRLPANVRLVNDEERLAAWGKHREALPEAGERGGLGFFARPSHGLRRCMTVEAEPYFSTESNKIELHAPDLSHETNADLREIKRVVDMTTDRTYHVGTENRRQAIAAAEETAARLSAALGEEGEAAVARARSAIQTICNTFKQAQSIIESSAPIARREAEEAAAAAPGLG